MLEKQCPRCGRLENHVYEGNPLSFVGFFCQDCFLASKDFYVLPRALTLRKCARCQRARFSKDFEPYADETMVAWVVSKIKPKYPVESFSGTVSKVKGGLDVKIKLDFVAHGAKVTKPVTLKIPVDSNACTQCSRQSGGYHESLIQLRGADKARLERMVSKISKYVEDSSYVGAVEWLKEGVDIQVGDKAAARQAVHSLEKSYTVSRTLTGQKKGKRLFRDTLLVRL